MRPLTWKQTFVTMACLAAIGFSHYAGTQDQAAIVAMAIAVFNWLREPPKPPPGAPTAPAVQLALVLFTAGTLACTVLH